MDYIELSMSNRLSAIEERMDKNDRNLDRVRSSYFMVEKKALELKAEKSTGENLLTDDIKFFFNLVKGGGQTPSKRSSKQNNPRRGRKDLSSSYNKENYPSRANGTI